MGEVSIHECKIDSEFAALMLSASVDERQDLEANVRHFGFLSPIITWRDEHGNLLILDGHARWHLWRAAVAMPEGAGLGVYPPAVVELDLPSRDDALLWILNNQLGRRNLSNVDRICLVRKKEELLKRIAKARKAATIPEKGERGFQRLVTAVSECFGARAETLDTRKQLAAEAGVGEHTYAYGKAILDAVDSGALPATVLDEIRDGKASISGVAKTLKATPNGKPKRSAKGCGWQTIVSGFTAAVRQFIKRDPQRRAEIAAELRRLADEVDSEEKAAA